MVSLRTIAEEAGVSESTVSRVLNNKNRNKISEATRERILAIARSLNYRPNPQAVALATGCPPNTLGLAMPYHSHTFRSFYFSEISCGALDAAYDQGMDVNLLVYRDNSPDPGAKFVSGQRVAGVILLGTEMDDPAIAAFRETDIPFVAVNYISSDPNVMTLRCDNEGGGYAATQHMIRLGHTRIAFLTGPARLPDAQERYQGFCRAMREAGLDIDPDLVVPGEFYEQGGRRAMRMLLDGRPMPTAVVAANDQSAIGAMNVAKRSGLKVPSDMAFIGFDDIPSAQHADPALTTIHQPIYRMGQRAARMLIARINGSGNNGSGNNGSGNNGSGNNGNGHGHYGRSAEMDPHQVLRTRLVVRESCGARRTVS